ncbi:hypothetical protein ABZ370_19170 [Streptomyces sp. NPDC005962]|uniref:hypothetical protein n=1 Tax=Streptomyces sp. NPDC005962 TaxID=3154466 RepID=UPI0033F0EB40
MRETTAADRSDTPAVALGPTALVLGVFSAVGVWTPTLMFFTFPWTIITGGLAIALGAMGIHHARRGAGRLWTAVAGTTLGGIGFAGVVWLLFSFSA